MKASEFIQKVQELMNEHGDKEIRDVWGDNVPTIEYWEDVDAFVVDVDWV